MPILEISGRTANRQRKANPYATWPTRGETLGDVSVDRVEPFAEPHFEANFKFVEGEAIFTIGSCFARNVEQLLAERGYEIPMRGLLTQKHLKLDLPGLANNYGVPSILQELKWALDPKMTFDPDAFFAEVKPDRFVDLNMPGGMRPEPWDMVAARRDALLVCTREVRRCRVVLITLGLTEVWFDLKTGHYLNVAPLPALLERDPDRFVLRVLSVGETIAILEEMMQLLKQYGAEGVQVLLTVSPIPMSATFREQDVLVANTYSKSTLRVAVEEIVGDYDFVHYFPSYESVVLSERSLAWLDDHIHVVPSLIALNVQRMLRAYAPETGEKDAAIVLRELRAMRGSSMTACLSFLQEHESVLLDDHTLSIEATKVATAGGDLAMARRLIETFPAETFPYWREALGSDIALVEHDWEAARILADTIAEANERGRQAIPISCTVHRLRMSAALGSGDINEALSAALLWSKASADGTIKPLLRVAAHLVRANKFAEAVSVFESVLHVLDAEPLSMAEYAEALWHVGRRDEAASIVERLEDLPTSVRLRLRSLSGLLDAGIESDSLS